MLRCPNCHQEHQTLRTLLTCCPRALRRLTNEWARAGASTSWPDLVHYLSGRPLPLRMRRVLDGTTMEDTNESR